MSCDLVFRSLREWPGTRTTTRIKALFSVPWSRRLSVLKSELTKLRVETAFLHVDAAPESMRRDGMIYADAKVLTPGIVLTFTKPGRGGAPAQEITMPHDVYWHWQDNVYAAALTLEALRAVARHGGAPDEQQYRGYARLGAGPGGVNTQAIALSPERAARILVEAHPTVGASNPAGLDVLARAGEIRDAAQDFLTWLSEAEAMLRSGLTRTQVRRLAAAHLAAGHARRAGRGYQLRACVVPRRVP